MEAKRLGAKMAISKKRIILILFVAVLALLAAYVLLRLMRPARLNQPESIAWNDSTRTFMVSNVGSGQILSLDKEGKYSVFAKGLDAPRGIKVVGNLLYVADNSQLKSLNLKTGALKASVPLKGAVMLNDIESDHLGRIYITDTKANRLYIHDPGTKLTESLESKLLNAPNGIVYDAPRRQMFIVSLSESSPILAFDIASKEFSVFRRTLYDNLDGIAIHDDGRIFYSSWGERCIFMINQEQNRTIIWQKDIQSPADIYYHKPTNEILVPIFEKNVIQRFSAD